MTSLDVLKKAEVFKELNDQHLAAVNVCCEIKEYKREDKIFSEGDDAAYLWIVAEGEVDIRFELPGRDSSFENNISTASAYAAFGWSGLVPPHKYRLSAYCATTNCKVIRAKRDSLLKLFEKDAAIGYRVMTNLTSVVGKRFNQLQENASASAFSKVRITVHLATCGIAAGAREVMTALMEEIAKSDRRDIQVDSAGCIGKCPTEPNVTVHIGGTDPVIYKNMNKDKMRRVFANHILKGEVQKDLALTA